MTGVAPDILLWNRVLVISEAMDKCGDSLTQVQSMLRGLEGSFVDASDPVEDFPRFATLRLCRSTMHLLGRLEELKTP